LRIKHHHHLLSCFYFLWCVHRLLDGFKCEFEVKTTEEQGIEARSQVHNTLGVERHVGAPR
jgi:hypothetical protein